MTNYIETITLHIAYDETTDVEIVVKSICYDGTQTHYRLVIKKWNTLGDKDLDSVVKEFDSETECVNWLNSLTLSSLTKCRDGTDIPTINNLYTNYFPVELDEPKFTEYTASYRASNENEIILFVRKEVTRN